MLTSFAYLLACLLIACLLTYPLTYLLFFIYFLSYLHTNTHARTHAHNQCTCIAPTHAHNAPVNPAILFLFRQVVSLEAFEREVLRLPPRRAALFEVVRRGAGPARLRTIAVVPAMGSIHPTVAGAVWPGALRGEL